MPDIRYVCISDLHLGEEDSLLTNVDATTGKVDTGSPSPVLVRLVGCLRELLAQNSPAAPKPTLILNGDAVELALSTMDCAAKVFAQFLELVMPPGGELFDEIIYLPGNHDHHLWELARETQYLNYMRRVENVADLEAPWHTTKVFMDMRGPDRLRSRFLTEIARRLLHLGDRNFEILAAYPNYGVLSADGRRAVVFHHGHFVESLYRAMTTFSSLVFSTDELPADLYSLEGENFAWIDFFWSSMGRSGKAGENIERLWEATGNRGSLQALTDSLAANLARRYDLLGGFDLLEELGFKALLRHVLVNRVAGQQERQRTESESSLIPLSADSSRGLKWYLEAMLRRQMEVEHGLVPEQVRFLFGHTHKPFERVSDFQGYPQPVQIVNTGGWIVETVDRRPQHGGAVALIDAELNAVNLRFYNEGHYVANAAEAAPADATRSMLWAQVDRLVRLAGGMWREFAVTVEQEVERRAEHLRRRLGVSEEPR